MNFVAENSTRWQSGPTHRDEMSARQRELGCINADVTDCAKRLAPAGRLINDRLYTVCFNMDFTESDLFDSITLL